MRLDRLDRTWRMLATGLAFVALFGGGPVLALIAVCTVRVMALEEPERGARVRYLIHRLFRLYVGVLLKLRILDLEMAGVDKLADRGGRLIIANHPTLLDVVLLIALLPRAQCVIKSELWDSPMLGRLMRAADYIRNDLPAEEMLSICRSALEAGNHLIIFPEGTRSRPGEPLRFRRGFAHIATLLNAEIQLVVLSCNPPTLLKGDKWWQVPARRPHFRVVIGDTIKAKDVGIEEHRSLTTRKLVRHLEDYYAEQLANG